jgi:hypothetical protein
VISIYELAAELAVPLEIVLGVHASTPTIARFEHHRRCAGRLQSIGGSKPGDAAATMATVFGTGPLCRSGSLA